jgi:hypothetical protein
MSPWMHFGGEADLGGRDGKEMRGCRSMWTHDFICGCIRFKQGKRSKSSSKAVSAKS